MKRSGVSVCVQTAFFAAALLAGRSSSAQEDATFQVQPLGGQSTFRVGERIPLELRFSSPEKDRFEINMASYDRSGRMSYEQFDVSPKGGWSDPLAAYFSKGYAGGGLSTTVVLGSTPTVMSIDLNEWVRFDQPGNYRVTVSSRRLTDLRHKHIFNVDPSETIQAKPFLLRIIPATPEWQGARLQAALAQLAAAPMTQGQQPAKRKAAIADLRFLGTKQAIQELAANLREDRADAMYQSAFGLMGVNEAMRGVALAALEEKIADPAFPIGGWFLQTMEALEAGGDRSRSKEEAWREVLAGLPRKQGKAEAATVQTLSSNPPAGISADAKAELGGVLSASLVDLTEEQRTRELTWKWDLLRSGSVLPVLEASAKLTLAHPGSNEMSAATRRDLKSIAFARWYELDPPGATGEIMAQIGSATPSLTAQSLAFLPKQTLPQFEGVWAQRLVDSGDYQEETVLGGLLVRFGTGSASAQVVSKLKTKVGAWACAPQAAALAYLVKFDPEEARPLLQQAVDAGRPGKTGCHQSLFQDVSADASGAVLTDVAVTSLDNADRRVAMDALIYLANHGRKEDQRPIWDRYVRWSEQWSGKDVLDSNEPALRERIYPEIGVGANLARALIANQGWLADGDLIARVVKMCAGEQMCQQVRRIAASAGPPYSVTFSRSAAGEIYEVGQYSAQSIELLDQKVGQYPRGTVFQLNPIPAENQDQKGLEKEVRGVFEKQGMALEAVHGAGSP